jgi:NADH-quinone oxidoreductase subunit E
VSEVATHGFSERTVEAARRIVARYPQPRSALLPLLYLVQAEEGRITGRGLAFCAALVGLTKAETQAVETYYEMYEHEDPGDWLITVCRNFSCKVRGAFEIHQRIVDGLGGARSDGVAVKWMECLGNCEGAPVVQVNYNNYERVTPQRADEILSGCRAGTPPPAVNGEIPPTFREVSWRLSGAEDGEVLQEAAVRGAVADVTAHEQPPSERIFDTDKPIGAPGVHRPGPEVGEAGDVEFEFEEPDDAEFEDLDDAEDADRDEEQIPSSEEQPIEDDARTPGDPTEER